MANPHHFGSLVDREAAEKLEFNDARLLRIHLRQFFQRLMQPEQIDRRLSRKAFAGQLARTGDRESLLARSAAFGRAMLARI